MNCRVPVCTVINNRQLISLSLRLSIESINEINRRLFYRWLKVINFHRTFLNASKLRGRTHDQAISGGSHNFSGSCHFGRSQKSRLPISARKALSGLMRRHEVECGRYNERPSNQPLASTNDLRSLSQRAYFQQPVHQRNSIRNGEGYLLIAFRPILDCF